jgi:predicted kinase
MIIFFGGQGSGKSTFWRNYLSDRYKRINNDTIQNPSKALKLARESLKRNESIVIDNCGTSKEARGKYIAIAKELKV